MYFWNSIYQKYVHNRECVIIYYHPTPPASSNHHQEQAAEAISSSSSSLQQLQSVLEVCLRCLPLRIGAMHICISKDDDGDAATNKDDDYSNEKVPIFWKSLPSSLQIRTAFHCAPSPTPVVASSSDSTNVFDTFFQKELRRYGISTMTLEDTHGASATAPHHKTNTKISSKTATITWCCFVPHRLGWERTSIEISS